MKQFVRQTIRWFVVRWLVVLCLLMSVLMGTTLMETTPAWAQATPSGETGTKNPGAENPSPPTWTLDDLQKQQSVVEQYREKVTQQKEQLQQIEGVALERLGGLKKDLQDTTSQLSDNEQKLLAATQNFEKIQAELDAVEAKYTKRRDITAERLQYLQRHNRDQNWATLLQSRTLEELLDKRYHLKRVYQADQKVLVDLKYDADRVNAKKLEIESQKNQISLLLQQLNSQKSQYELQTSAQRDLVLRLNTDKRALEAAASQLAQDSKNLSTLIQQRIAVQSSYQNGSPPLPGSGQMILPTSGSITSQFGLRVHPILGTSRFHDGLDIGAEEGSPIVAADNGTVIVAEWYGGYGNAVIIDHGNNITTLYGHCSQLYVSVGTSVKKGQLIAAVGSTGLSTGPHLHFEVRTQGSPTDPVAFL